MKTGTILALCLTAGLAACGPFPRGGAGASTDGTPVTATRFIHNGWREDVKFTSAAGWSCEGTVSLYNMFDRGDTSETMPVTCDNGARGTATVSFPHQRRDMIRPGEINYVFRLDNGQMGQFRI